jgi:ammonia channel protein AmtB
MPLNDFYGQLESLKTQIDLVWILMGTALILFMNFGLMFSEVGSVS